MDIKVVATEGFIQGNKTYFLDLRQGVNGTLFIKLTRSDRQPDERYAPQPFIVFQECFDDFVTALRDLFATAGHQLAAEERPLKHVGTPGGIKGWGPDKRPREKMMASGPESLSDAELVAILIGSGSLQESAVSLAARILASVDYSLTRFSRLNLADLYAFHGMGKHRTFWALLAHCPNRPAFLRPLFKFLYLLQFFPTGFFASKFLNAGLPAKTGALRVCWKKIFPGRSAAEVFFSAKSCPLARRVQVRALTKSQRGVCRAA